MEIPLQIDGVVLPEGTYTVEAWLNTQPEEQFAAANSNRSDLSNLAAPTSSPFGNISGLIGDTKKVEPLQQDHIAQQKRAMQD